MSLTLGSPWDCTWKEQVALSFSTRRFLAGMVYLWLPMVKVIEGVFWAAQPQVSSRMH